MFWIVLYAFFLIRDSFVRIYANFVPLCSSQEHLLAIFVSTFFYCNNHFLMIWNIYTPEMKAFWLYISLVCLSSVFQTGILWFESPGMYTLYLTKKSIQSLLLRFIFVNLRRISDWSKIKFLFDNRIEFRSNCLFENQMFRQLGSSRIEVLRISARLSFTSSVGLFITLYLVHIRRFKHFVALVFVWKLYVPRSFFHNIYDLINNLVLGSWN